VCTQVSTTLATMSVTQAEFDEVVQKVKTLPKDGPVKPSTEDRLTVCDPYVHTAEQALN
jgi:hypothetical protein